MKHIERTITVDKPAERVWEYLSDFRSTNDWDPGTVLTERVDIFDLKEGRRVAIRVMGAFEVNEQNLITHWRDYFDLADWNRQMRLDPDFARRADSMQID